MNPSPSIVVFDVNETLSDLTPLRRRFADVGAAEALAATWFAAVLRDGIGLAAAGAMERFAVIGAHNLRLLLGGLDLDRSLDDAVEHVMSGFLDLPVHPDVPDGVRALRAAGLRLVTLSNGATRVAETLLTAAGIRDEFAALLSVEDAGVWKPARAAYEYAAQRCGSEASEMVLVAVHPWDTDGAARAGMQTAWLDRRGVPYPPYARRPTYTIGSLGELATTLSRDE